MATATNVSKVNGFTYYKEIPPTQTQASNTAYVIHANAPITYDMYTGGIVDGDTMVFKQSPGVQGIVKGKEVPDAIMKPNKDNYPGLCNMRLIGINAPEISHFTTNKAGKSVAAYKDASGKFVDASTLKGADLTEYNKEKLDYPNGDNAKNFILKILGVDVPSLKAKKTATSNSSDLVIVIDRLQINKTNDPTTNGNVIVEPGQDVYGRYLGCIYVKNPDNGDWINVNKTMLLQTYNVVPFLFTDKNGGINAAPVFNMEDYEKLYTVSKGGEDELKTDNAGSYGSAAVDDRLDSAISLGLLTDGFEDWTTLIGDSLLVIPPSGIQVTKSTKGERVKVVRSKNSIEKGSGHTDYEIRMDAFFDGSNMINGYKYEQKAPNGETQTYYVHGLRQLIAQFRKTPFLPIINSYLNFSYNIEAVTLTNMTFGTVDGMPGLIRVQLIMTDFEPRTHILGLGPDKTMADLIHWPLFRYYYQKSFDSTGVKLGHTYFPPVPDKLTGEVKFSVINNADLDRLAQEANILALNKVKNTSTVKTIDEVMFEQGMPISASTNYDAYVNMLADYKKFLKFYIHQSITSPTDAVKKYTGSFVNDNPGFGPVCSWHVQKVFMYLRKEDDYYLSQALYKKVGLILSLSDMEFKQTYPITFKWTNSFFLHSDFGEKIKGKLIAQNRIDAPDQASESNPNAYALQVTLDGIKDAWVYSLSDATQTILTPEICIVNFRFGELIIDNLRTAADGLNATEKAIHEKIVALAVKEGNSLGRPVMPRMTHIITNMIQKKKDYDAMKALEQGKADADKTTAAANANLEKLQHQSDLDDLEFKFDEMDFPFSPTAINVSFENTFSYLQVLNFNTPTKQYMGGSDTVIQLEYMVEGKEAIKKFNYMFDYTTYIVRHYRSYISDGFIKVENELINMAGVNYVVISDIDIKEVPDYPNIYSIRITLVAFDRTQRNKEELKKIASLNETYTGDDQKLIVAQEASSSYVTLIDSLKNSELYPDLELPTNEELSAKGFFITPNNGKYPDPDFYLSYTDMFMIAKIIQDHIVSKEDLGKAFVIDSNTGHSLSFDAGKPLADLIPSESLTAAVKLTQQKVQAKEDAAKAAAAGTAAAPGTDGTVAEVQSAVANGVKVTGGFYSGGVVQVNGMTMGLGPTLKTFTKNIAGLRDRFVIVSGIDKDLDKYYNQELIAFDAHTVVNTVCEKYGIPSDCVIRGLVHTLVESESKAYHWSKYDESTKLAKGKGVTAGEGKGNVSATDVGIMKIDIKGSYDASQATIICNNPGANIGLGLQKLIACYKQTFSGLNGGKNGMYSDTELDQSTIKQAPPASRISASNLAFWTPVRIMEATASLPKIDAALKDPSKTLYVKKWWMYNEDPVLVAYYSDTRTNSYVANAIKADPNKADRPALIASIKLLKKEMGIYISTKKNPRLTNVDTSTFGADHKIHTVAPKFDSATVLTYKGCKADVNFERGRWMVACLLYDGRTPASITPNTLKAIKAFIEGKFNSAAITTENGANKASMINLLRNLTSGPFAQQAITGNYNEKSAYQVYKDPEDADYFGDFNGDPALYVDDNSIFKDSLYDSTHFDKRGRLSRAYPTFFLCLIDEGNTIFNWKLHDNFYGYSSISDIQIMRSRKMAASTCTVQMSNMFDAFWNWDDDKMYQRQSSFADVTNSIFDTEAYAKNVASKTRNADTNKSMLKPGARIHIRMGYSANARDLPIMFNGTITEIEQGEIIQIVAQGDGIELCNKIPASPKDTTETAPSTTGDENILQRFLGYVTGSSSEPRNVIVDMFHTKGGFWKSLIYSISGGKFFNSNPLGIIHFGNPEFKLIFNDGGEVSQNVFAAMNPITVDCADGKKRQIVAFNDSDDAFAENDEPNFSMYLYNKTPWDVIQVCRMLIPDFVASVEPFEFRSTLFYGKSYYPFAYQYDYTTLDKEKMATMMEKIMTAEKSATVTTEIAEQAAAAATTVVPTSSASTSAPKTSGTDGPGGSNLASVWGFFKGKGFNDLGAAAVCGNLQQENNFSTSIINSIGAAGLCQWTKERRSALEAAAKKAGKPWTNLTVQLTYMYGEMTAKGSFIAKLKATTDLKASVKLFENVFEVSGESRMDLRNQYAASILKAYTGKTGTTSDSAGSDDATVAQKIAISIAKYKDVNTASPLKEQRKSFQQTHIMTSHFDIMDNKIKASVNGVYTNVIGTYVGKGAGDKSASYQTPVIYADTDIWDEKQKTAMVDCQYYAKGVPLLGLVPYVNAMKTFFYDEGKAINIGTSSLVDYMKDMYQGEMIVVGYPAIKPYDMMFISDEFNQMNGLCEVQQVIQHFSVDDGFTTSITPDACVTAHDQHIKTGWTLKSSVAPIAALIAGKVGSMVLGMRIFGFTRFSIGMAGKMINTGLTNIKKATGAINSMKNNADIVSDIAAQAEAADDIAGVAADTKTEASLLSKMKTISTEKLKQTKIIKDVIMGVKDTEETAKAIEVASKAGAAFVEAAEAGIVIANLAEVAIVFIADRALITWIKRFIRNRQAIAMTLLMQHGREMSAGINGHRGLVIGDTPGITDSLITGVLNSTLAKLVLGDEPGEVANVTYSKITGVPNTIDVKYSDDYTAKYIADSNAALEEMTVMMGSSLSTTDDPTTANSATALDGKGLIAYASTFLGVPYLWTGTTPKGFDCSGFTQYVYAHFGITIGRNTIAQESAGKASTMAKAKVGDLLLYGSAGATHHVTMYIGDGKMIEAPHTGANVRIRTIDTPQFVRHIVDLDAAGVPITTASIAAATKAAKAKADKAAGSVLVKKYLTVPKVATKTPAKVPIKVGAKTPSVFDKYSLTK